MFICQKDTYFIDILLWLLNRLLLPLVFQFQLLSTYSLYLSLSLSLFFFFLFLFVGMLFGKQFQLNSNSKFMILSHIFLAVNIFFFSSALSKTWIASTRGCVDKYIFLMQILYFSSFIQNTHYSEEIIAISDYLIISHSFNVNQIVRFLSLH